MTRHRVIFQPSGRRGEVEEGKSLRDAANELGVGVEQVCGGNKVCGKCKVQIQEGYFSKFDVNSSMENLSPLAEEERGHLREEELERNYRLACASAVHGDLLVFVPEESRVGGQVVRKAAGEIDIEIDPAVKKYYVELPKPSLEDPEGDLERLLQALNDYHGLEGLSIDYRALRKMPDALREGKWKATVSILNHQIINVQAGLDDRALGIAFDVGTTTVVGYLTDLRNGKVLAIDSMMNPQVGYGEDVMSRLTYAMEQEDGLARMHQAIVEGINKIIGNLCEEAEVSREDVLEIVVVGNTAMHHIYLNIYPEYLGISPFTPALHQSLDIKARDLKIDIAPGGNVHVPPVEAGFVGADNMGVVMATEPEKKEDPWLIIDIGTNGEIVLGSRDKLLSTSCATGPAFEGAQIKFGMRAAPGAIERVRIDPETKEPRYKVIGREEWSDAGTLVSEEGSQLAWTREKSMARGICGSGIIEAIAEMFKAGVIKNSGVFNTELETPRIRRDEKDQPEYVLAWSYETAIDRDITVNQADVRALQLAKGALYTGCKILMKHYGIDRVERVILAGAFGNYIDREASMVIGMFPDCDLEKVSAVGNAAGDGARIALLNRRKREEANRIARRIKYIELTVDPEFQTEFMEAMYFPHMKDKFPHLQAILDEINR